MVAAQARMQLGRIAVTEVAEEIRLDVTLREELLIAAEAWFAGREELLVHLCVIEAGHRPTVETERTCRHDQVSALQAGVALRRRFHHLRIALEQLDDSRILREH